MGGFLKQLCVLQTHDELEFFPLHALYFRFILLLLVGFSLQFFFNLCPSAVLPRKLIQLTLVASLLFLLLHKGFNGLGLLFLLSPLHFQPLTHSRFVLLGLDGRFLDLDACCCFGLSDNLFLLLFELSVHLGAHVYVLLLLGCSCLLLLIDFNISLSL